MSSIPNNQNGQARIHGRKAIAPRLPAAIEREGNDPQESSKPMSLTFVLFIALVFFWSGFYVQRYSGGYKGFEYNENSSGLGDAKPVASAPVDPFTLGKRLFADSCGKCHQSDGLGLPGQYPPLAGSEWVQAAGTARIIRIVLDGAQGHITVKGVGYNNQMIPWRDVFSDVQIAAVLTYIRGEKAWGNSAPPVTPEEVAAIREKTKAHAALGPWSPDELLKLPEIEPTK
jgi:mono/diheme cytochrome c family protein